MAYGRKTSVKNKDGIYSCVTVSVKSDYVKKGAHKYPNSGTLYECSIVLDEREVSSTVICDATEFATRGAVFDCCANLFEANSAMIITRDSDELGQSGQSDQSG